MRRNLSVHSRGFHWHGLGRQRGSCLEVDWWYQRWSPSTKKMWSIILLLINYSGAGWSPSAKYDKHHHINPFRSFTSVSTSSYSFRSSVLRTIWPWFKSKQEKNACWRLSSKGSIWFWQALSHLSLLGLLQLLEALLQVGLQVFTLCLVQTSRQVVQ